MNSSRRDRFEGEMILHHSFEDAMEGVRRQIEHTARLRDARRLRMARRRAAFIHRALARGAAHKRKQEARRADEEALREVCRAVYAVDMAEEEFEAVLVKFFDRMAGS